MTIQLYIDEDAMDTDLVRALRGRGLNVITAHEAGLDGYPDEEHLKHASREGRVLYSFNIADYYLLHTHYLAQGLPHAGIILSQQGRYSIGE